MEFRLALLLIIVGVIAVAVQRNAQKNRLIWIAASLRGVTVDDSFRGGRRLVYTRPRGGD